MPTLAQILLELFPDSPISEKQFGTAPKLPADVFAFAATILERSGAYHHVAPVAEPRAKDGLRRILIDEKMRKRARLLGRQWRSGSLEPRLPQPPKRVEQLWATLDEFRDEAVFKKLDDKAPPPEWWGICLELLMIADEASAGSGFDASNPFVKFVLEALVAVETGTDFDRLQSGPFSISTAASDVLCVQAKSRTTSVGCTLRSLTHHLALLPPRGEVRARWVEPLFKNNNKELDRELSLLLVPFPYRIDDAAFKPSAMDPTKHWGWFRASQKWLPRDGDRTRRRGFIRFVEDLISQARKQNRRVDGVVLPELALNHSQFVSLGRSLSRDVGIDFLIAGLSDNEKGRKGNFVAIAPFFLLERKGKLSGWERTILIREKHHRWKLNRPQIEAYGLGLDSKKSWWEDLAILSRSLDVLVYRNKTSLTTLICEDLARVDPCQAVVRAIGPDLLIALLMDGPQRTDRWPGRYAAVLADDPGTSVLCFTSLGLIARQNKIGQYAQSSGVALWKDESYGAKSLELPREGDALVLLLKAESKEERTLDGRSDNQTALRWVYDGHVAVTATYKPRWISSGSGRR